MVQETNHTTIKAPTGYYKLSGELVASTEKAKLFRVDYINDLPFDESAEEHWFPISQIKSSYRRPIGDTADRDVLIVSNWICQQKGLI